MTFLAWFLNIINVAIPTVIAFYFLWEKQKAATVGLVLVTILTAVGVKYLDNASADAKQAVVDEKQDKLQKQIGGLEAQLERANSSLVEGQKLITDMSKDVKGEKLRQEVEGYMLRNRVSQMEQGSSSPRRNAMGDSPEESIAKTLQHLSSTFVRDLESYLMKLQSRDPLAQMLSYYSAVEKIPSFYNEEEWAAAEGVIFAHLKSDITSDLSRRGLYSPEKAEHVSSTLRQERQRYLEARKRTRSAPAAAAKQ